MYIVYYLKDITTASAIRETQCQMYIVYYLKDITTGRDIGVSTTQMYIVYNLKDITTLHSVISCIYIYIYNSKDITMCLALAQKWNVMYILYI